MHCKNRPSLGHTCWSIEMFNQKQLGVQFELWKYGIAKSHGGYCPTIHKLGASCSDKPISASSVDPIWKHLVGGV